MLEATREARDGRTLPDGQAGRGRPARPPAEVPARRGRRHPELGGVATPLSATFLGLLLIQGFGAAEARGEGLQPGGGGAGGDAPAPGGEAEAAGAAGGAVLGGGTASGFGAGSLLAFADPLDPAGLTALGGEARFDEGLPSSLQAPAGGSEAAVSAAGAGATGEVKLSLGVAGPVGEAGDFVEGDPPDPDARNNPIGRVDQGTDGDDTLIGTDGDDFLSGGAGNDLIRGEAGDDSLDGGSGNDRVYGGAGNDDVAGGTGDDRLWGGSGNDTLDGGSGNDRVWGGTGQDTLFGGSGNDLLDGGPGIDSMFGGTGRDVLVVDHLHDLAFEDGHGADGGGVDTLVVAPGYATSLRDALPHLAPEGQATFVLGTVAGVALPAGANPFVQSVHPDIENVRLQGDAAHDILGDGRDNRLAGNDGHNRLYGGAGEDWLDGGGGNDWLDGGEGDDLLYGAGGDDVFVLGLQESGVDTIFDHEGVNTIRLAGAASSKLAASLEGDDLHLAYDGRQIAVIKQYAGHEGSFAGIDLGAGARPLGEFIGPAGGSVDLLAEYLPRPDIEGGPGNDILQGTSKGEWIAGRAGNDTLYGGGGDDRLEGGPGMDRLEGGAGNDTYVFNHGEGGVDRIADLSGRNIAEVNGVEAGKLGAFLSGQDLWVVAEGQPMFVVEGFAAHPDSFLGVRAGERVIDPNELLS